MPMPEPKEEEVLVRVYAAGVTGDEVHWPELYETPTRIPGHEFSGVISAVGPNYNGPLEIGQAVFASIGATPGPGEGQADYAICHPNEVVLKPIFISHQEAAALPIPLLTAWEAIVDHAHIKPGMKLLITGGSGAVGSITASLAAHFGARVVALASSQHHDKLRELGAEEVIDYRNFGWDTQIKNIDVVFDTVGGDVLASSWDVVKPDGVIITIADPAPSWAFEDYQPIESAGHPDVRYKYFIFVPNAERLSKAAAMVDSGVIKPLAITSFSFEQAEKAWALAKERNRGKKVVIQFVED